MGETKIFREKEIAERKDKSTLLIIHDNVYDVSKFLEEVSSNGCLTTSESHRKSFHILTVLIRDIFVVHGVTCSKVNT